MFSLEKTIDGLEHYLEGKILLTAILDRLNFSTILRIKTHK